MTPLLSPMQKTGHSRRRAMQIMAGAAGVCALGAGVRALAPPARFFRWRGEVLGAVAEIALWSGDEHSARSVVFRIERELARFHRIFDLQNEASEISRLNRDGALSDASRELRALIAESQTLGELSGGAFDISVQPVWRVYESHFWTKADIAADIAAKALATARALVDFRGIEIVARRIAFARPGMAVTLNGIAQGFIADAIADLLRNEGYDTAFVDLGEMRAIGAHPDGRAWRVGLKHPGRADSINRAVDLEDAALAVSGGYGTTFEPTGRFHHIFDPATGASANSLRDVAVIGPRAAAADGLSTAIYVAGEAKAAALLAAYPGNRALLTRLDLSVIEIAPA